MGEHFVVFALLGGGVLVMLFGIHRVRLGSTPVQSVEPLPGHIRTDRLSATDENLYTPELLAPSPPAGSRAAGGKYSAKGHDRSPTMMSLNYKPSDECGLSVSVQAGDHAAFSDTRSRRKAMSTLMNHLHDQRNVRPPFSLSVELKEAKTGLSIAKVRLESSECAGLDAAERMQLIDDRLFACIAAGCSESEATYV